MNPAPGIRILSSSIGVLGNVSKWLMMPVWRSIRYTRLDDQNGDIGVLGQTSSDAAARGAAWVSGQCVAVVLGMERPTADDDEIVLRLV